jgi:hypothetical protein
MTANCIHAVPTQQCSSCRICDHGLAFARCARCQAALAAKPNPAPLPPEIFEHHEIFFVPAENSWYYRAPEPAGSTSRESYRSAFQARRAVVAALAAPPRVPTPAGGKARKARKR